MNFKKMVKRFWTLSKHHEGFTLVELIVVIAIMAILAGVAVPAYTGYIEKAEKANDLQLLGAVNTAFGAAVMEELNVSTSQLPDGYATFDPSSKTVSAHNDTFLKYFKGNETAEFKVFKSALIFEDGVFKDASDSTIVQNAVGRFEGSNFAGDVETLAGSVNNLAGMLGDRIGNEGPESLLKPHMDALGEGEYDAFMEKYGLTKDSDKAEIANATVMYVADQLSGVSASDIQSVMAESGPQGVVTKYGNITTAAMMYGLMTGYANSSYGTNYTLEEPEGVTEVLGEFMTLYNNDKNFQEYFNTSNKGGMADMDGFLGAMDVVNSYEGSFDLTNENLFVSDETNALLNSILGTNATN